MTSEMGEPNSNTSAVPGSAQSVEDKVPIYLGDENPVYIWKESSLCTEKSKSANKNKIPL